VPDQLDSDCSDRVEPVRAKVREQRARQQEYLLEREEYLQDPVHKRSSRRGYSLSIHSNKWKKYWGRWVAILGVIVPIISVTLPPIVLGALGSFRGSGTGYWREVSPWFFLENGLVIFVIWPFFIGALIVSLLLRWSSSRWMEWGIRCGIIGMFIPVVANFSVWWFNVSQMASRSRARSSADIRRTAPRGLLPARKQTLAN